MIPKWTKGITKERLALVDWTIDENKNPIDKIRKGLKRLKFLKKVLLIIKERLAAIKLIPLKKTKIPEIRKKTKKPIVKDMPINKNNNKKVEKRLKK